MRIVIIGGGFVGRLLHTIFPTARVLDWRDAKPPTDPRQIGPQYLWEPIPQLECRRFAVITTIDGRPATDDRVLSYKKKVGKELDGSDWRSQFRLRMPGYNVTLPPDRVEYGCRVLSIDGTRRLIYVSRIGTLSYDYLLSTIPLYSLLSLLKDAEYLSKRVPRLLTYRPIFVNITPLSWYVPRRYSRNMWVDYRSDPLTDVYRETIRGGRRYQETLQPHPGLMKILPGKIYKNSVSEMALKALRSYRIHPFGRFATWDPDELAHETYWNAMAWARVEGILS